jgi:hypothetical protein
MTWSPQSPYELTSLTSRTRSAVAIGTILLSTAGVLAGLAFTFLPTAFGLQRRFRAWQRSRAPRQHSGTARG